MTIVPKCTKLKNIQQKQNFEPKIYPTEDNNKQ